jgi:hypothetical protein
MKPQYVLHLKSQRRRAMVLNKHFTIFAHAMILDRYLDFNTIHP